MENIPNEIGPSPLLTFSQCPIFWLKSTSSKESLHSDWQLVHRAALFCIVKRGVPLNQGEGLTTKDVSLFTPFIDYFVQQMHLTLLDLNILSKAPEYQKSLIFFYAPPAPTDAFTHHKSCGKMKTFGSKNVNVEKFPMWIKLCLYSGSAGSV